MKRSLIPVVVLAALPLAAQQQASPVLTTGGNTQTASPMVMAPAPVPTPSASSTPAGDRPVATVNGETITAAKLDALWARLTPQIRDSYDANGGKPAFLDNYMRKRLLIQEALKTGFDRRPDVQADLEAARESALFDSYVRDVVAASVVTDAAMKQYYDDHTSEFQLPERAKVRHIVIVPNGAGPRPKTKEQALELIKQVASELHQQNIMPGADPATAQRLALAHFADAARKYSEDGSAQSGGDLGWVGKGGGLDPDFEAAAFKMTPGVVSGIVETRFGYHLIYVEGKKPAGLQPFEEVKPRIRFQLLAEHQPEIIEAVSKLTNELRGASKLAVYPENIQ